MRCLLSCLRECTCVSHFIAIKLEIIITFSQKLIQRRSHLSIFDMSCVYATKSAHETKWNRIKMDREMYSSNIYVDVCDQSFDHTWVSCTSFWFRCICVTNRCLCHSSTLHHWVHLRLFNFENTLTILLVLSVWKHVHKSRTIHNILRIACYNCICEWMKSLFVCVTRNVRKTFLSVYDVKTTKAIRS